LLLSFGRRLWALFFFIVVLGVNGMIGGGAAAEVEAEAPNDSGAGVSSGPAPNLDLRANAFFVVVGLADRAGVA